MKRKKLTVCLLGAAMVSSLFTAGCGQKTKDPVTVSVWTYYNGDQLEAFNDLVDKFNDTTGKEKGITVESQSLGTVDELEKSVLTYLAESSLLAEEGIIIVEASKETDFDYAEDLGYNIIKEKEYKTNKHVFLEPAGRKEIC